MNIVYNASAGTGKTYQVTSLYEKLVLEEGIDPRKILLMTFTDNAAAELRMRVAHRFQKARRTAEQADDFETVERTITALSRLPSAPIGTIHGFCTRLLREHALEAGLSPGFSVLIGDERDELLSRICRDELLKKLDTDAHFRIFCSGMQMIGTGKGFGSSITDTVPKLIGDAGSLGIALDQATSMLPEPQPPVSIVDFIQISNDLKNLSKRTKKIEEAIQTLENALEQTDEPETLIELFNNSFSGHFSYGEAKTIYPRFKELKEETVARERYRARFPAAKSFAEYLQAVSTRFKQAKHDMDSVDFDDQLQMASALLTSGKAKPEFQYVIVDEVQDTSRIQCDLIQALWGAETNLVICGDKKQSIYTWRGADPQVMPDLEAAILERENSCLENLQTSYRSKAPILDVVNTLFSDVYGPEEYAAGDRLEANPDFKTEGEKPCVEFLQYDGDEDLDKPEKVAAEMEAVANRIQLLVNGSNDWKPAFRHSDAFLPTSGTNDYRYSDVLILLRRTSHQSTLEQALRHAGIPYTLGGKGRGLFTRQETRDVALFLSAITNPDDAYALIGFLRSPWIGLSDQIIAELAWSEKGFSIETLKAYFSSERADRNVCSTLGEADIPVCQPAELLQRYRNLTGTKLASELVRMLIEETDYDAVLAGLPRGTQRLANLRKVLDWLRETERGAQTTPAMVARKLAEQIASPPQVPEAALLDPAQNAVTIMTVHGSKGLTKRVVVIPDTSFQPDSDRDFARIFLDEQKIPALGIRITEPNKNQAASPGFKKANERAKLVREHELKNLFYVAMTRARDLVITSGTIGRNPSGWMKTLEPMIGKEIPAIPFSSLAAEAKAAPLAEISIPDPAQLASTLNALSAVPAIPALQRMPATRFAKEQDEIEIELQYESSNFQPLENAAALGSLGHTVLEQLALNNWDGDIFQWLEIFRHEFDASKTEALTLAPRIEDARAQMIDATRGMSELRPEFPFVLQEGNNLIDGTIDLLCQTASGFSIFDYKFTEATDQTVAANYQEQMNIYRKAAEKLYPSADEASTLLVVISSKGTRFIKCM
ncbi:UvrD-helicase domain-containing protein [Pontiellaceae bacterium B1224]|nr:UvrD-helicase domain-containing protein [Pontiellaceae bacterium B1224]